MDLEVSMKEAIIDVLNCSLSPNKATRESSEQRIAALEVTEEYGIYLTQFVVDPSGSPPKRQLASVLLKQYVENHWSSLSNTFRPPELKPLIKAKIKELLILGLKEPLSKVRSAVAHAISKIASWDWPENWPELFDILIAHLNENDEHSVHGAMRVMVEFTRDMSDNQLPNVGPIILQEMYRILSNDKQYAARIRARAVEVFTTVTQLVTVTAYTDKGLIDKYLQPVLPVYCEKFVEFLSCSDPRIDCGFKTEIVKSVNWLVLNVSKKMTPYVPQILSAIWNILIECAKLYHEEIITGDENDKEVDSDGQVITFHNLIIALLEFIGAMVDHKRYAPLLDKFVHDIMYYSIIFGQATEDQLNEWEHAPDAFVEEETVAVTYTVRISALELLSTLLSQNEELCVGALGNAISKHIEEAIIKESNAAPTQENNNLWKIYESCIIALNIAKSSIVSLGEAGKLPFDIVKFLDSIVMTTLNNPNAHPILLSRCLIIAGRYAKELPPEMSSKFLEAIINGLQPQQIACLRVASAKSIFYYADAAVTNESITLLNMLRPNLPAIFDGLLSIAGMGNKEILIIVLDTLSVIAPVDKAFTASVENKICPLAIAAFVKFHSDHEISGLCQDIFKELTVNPECIGALQNRLVPTLISMLNVGQNGKTTEEGLRAEAMEVLGVLVQFSPAPLSSALMDSAFPVACHCIIESTDNSVLQNGGEVIRYYLTVSPQQVLEHRDPEGRTGLQYVLEVIRVLLDPQSSEFSACYVGKLIVTLIRKAGNCLGDTLDQLLKGVLSKMQRTETSTVMQSLLIIYAHLINSNFNAVLNFLSTVPGPTGESALAFVLREWANKQKLFFGNYDRKVSTVALCKLLEYGVTQGDERLNDILVEGAVVQGDGIGGIETRTRSKAGPIVFAQIPILVKIFKLIVYELMHYLEVNAAEQEGSEDSEDDDEEGDVLVDSLRMIGDDREDDMEEELDPDIRKDEIYLLDMGQYLRDFLQNFSTHPGFPQFAQHVTPDEKKVLNSINIV
ncbi:importin-9 isoform X1 [Trichogramma pretiosum]|uniref:importin-9 isoform X1 n=1 Tax=Trichogramma pretiosum TaxID=7493 RepID=UPI0006C9AC3E|nr:importin-9 isoform X1 [Trichogramma pretiosum]